MHGNGDFQVGAFISRGVDWPRLTQREECRRQRLSLATQSMAPIVRRLILELERMEPNELFGVSARRPKKVVVKCVSFFGFWDWPLRV
jgi:hypothetical protein